MKTLKWLLLLLYAVGVNARQIPVTVDNPVLPGFHPDPSICRVGDDYYLCNSSFTWYPGLPIYHSKDLVNWELVGHVIDRPEMVSLDGVKGKDGIYAPTLRHHNDTWYVFYFVVGLGNYYVTAKDVRGPWSDPVLIRNMPGIDPSPFWDVDGRSYVVGNHWSYPNRKHAASAAIWIQEIDLTKGVLTGERHYLTTGHAFNAKYAEGAHLYYIGNKYVLLVAEGGTDYYHAETVMVSDSIMGPYLAQTINPVLSQRQLGYQSPIQCVGHCDLVQTQHGDWYAVALGKRMVNEKYAFTRETFLCPVEIQNGELVFNPGYGSMTSTIPRPKLPWTPVKKGTQWYFERVPYTDFYSSDNGRYTLRLLPETVDSLVSPAMLMRKPSSLSYSVETRLLFDTKRPNEHAGLILYRNNNAYVALLKSKGELQVVCKEKGKKTVLSAIPYQAKDVEVRLTVDGINACFEYGQTSGRMLRAATVSLVPLAEDEQENRFNGIGVGMYASSNGMKSNNRAAFERFDYHDPKGLTHYLFAYFTSDKAGDENVLYAVSSDGLDYRPLNGGMPVVLGDTTALSKGLRDPHLLRGNDGWFRLVATDMQMSQGKFSNRGIVMMRSRDLIHWEHHTVHFPDRYMGKDPAKANAVWAPQTFYDPTVGKYMVYFSLHSEESGPYPQDMVYYAYANDGFSDLEDEPQRLFYYPYPTIDSDIVQDKDGHYHLFFNTWGCPDGLGIHQFVFDNLHDPRTWRELPGKMQPDNAIAEGVSVYPLADGTWIMMYDCFKDGHYEFCRSRDLTHFELVKKTTDFQPRHGSVLRITEEEYDRLVTHYGL